MQLSSHFTLEEMVASSHRSIDNTPGERERIHLRLLCEQVLEPARMLLGPMHVTSGYRCEALNAAVGGSQGSQHIDGLAADVVPTRMGLAAAARLLVASAVPFDQLIFEFGRWLHLSRARPGAAPRRQALMIGSWTGGRYAPLDLAHVLA